MTIDRSNAFVTITLEGLFVICKNDRINPPRWEIGVPLVPDAPSDGHCGPHNFSVNVFKITGSGNRMPFPPGDSPNSVTLATNRSIEIINDLSSPVVPLTYYAPSVTFDRQETDDPHDFRWLVDLESRFFHDEGVIANPDKPKHHKLKVFIDGGQLYTLDKSVEQYKRFRTAQDVLHLRKLGLSVGIALPRAETADHTVTIQNKGGQNQITMLQEVGVRYEVELKHVCPPSDEPTGADFDLYYEILRANDGTRFQILTEAAAIPNVPGPPRGGNEPQVCNTILLSQNERLPGSSAEPPLE